jgi:hypothetical protein
VAGIEIEVRESAAIRRVAWRVAQIRTARIA